MAKKGRLSLTVLGVRENRECSESGALRSVVPCSARIAKEALRFFVLRELCGWKKATRGNGSSQLELRSEVLWRGNECRLTQPQHKDSQCISVCHLEERKSTRGIRQPQRPNDLEEEAFTHRARVHGLFAAELAVRFEADIFRKLIFECRGNEPKSAKVFLEASRGDREGSNFEIPAIEIGAPEDRNSVQNEGPSARQHGNTNSDFTRCLGNRRKWIQCLQSS